MVRWVAIALAVLVICYAVVAVFIRRMRIDERGRWIQVRYQLDPPEGDSDWITRRLVHRDRGGLLGLALGAWLAILVALVTDPRGLTPLVSVVILGLSGWWLGQVAAESLRAAAGGGSYAITDFLPASARRMVWVLRFLPLVSLVLGFVYRHELAAVVVAVAQVAASAVLVVARRRSLAGREFGLTERGVQWARALHADAVRLQYLAEVFVLGLGSTLLAFYLYEFEVHARRDTAIPLGAVLFCGLLTALAAVVGRGIPGWARQQALIHEPVGY